MNCNQSKNLRSVVWNKFVEPYHRERAGGPYHFVGSHECNKLNLKSVVVVVVVVVFVDFVIMMTMSVMTFLTMMTTTI